jgi:hypothetical protein
MPSIEEVSASSMSGSRKHLSARGRRFPSSKGLVEPLLGHRKLRFVLECEGCEPPYWRWPFSYLWRACKLLQLREGFIGAEVYRVTTAGCLLAPFRLVLLPEEALSLGVLEPPQQRSKHHEPLLIFQSSKTKRISMVVTAIKQTSKPQGAGDAVVVH